MKFKTLNKVLIIALVIITNINCTRKTESMQFKTFVFSPFQENTFVLYDETKECIIVDAGNFSENENEQLDAFIKDKELKVVQLVNTHNHLDHVFGARYVVDNYDVKGACHPDDLYWIDNFATAAEDYGLQIEKEAPKPEVMLNHGDVFKFGNTELEIIHVPGHSPGGIALYNKKEGLLFAGDILFHGSIGRTDLPRGNHDDLINGIKEKLFVLPTETRVFCGHGPETTIGYEKASNPFLR